MINKGVSDICSGRYYETRLLSRTTVEVVSLLQKMSNTRERTITLDVEMEDYYRLKDETEKA